jgi:hypothetical protein
VRDDRQQVGPGSIAGGSPRGLVWDFWIDDRGGTFTDVVGRAPDGRCTRKLLSETPAPIATPRSRASATCSGRQEPIPARIGTVKMGTTVATNALLERKGDRTLLLITKGFRDALRIAYQARPDIFAKEIILPEQLYERVIEVDERLMADGTVERRSTPTHCATSWKTRRRTALTRRHRADACLEEPGARGRAARRCAPWALARSPSAMRSRRW